jgi:hypothetical protein
MLSLKAVLGLDGSGFEMGIKRAQSTAKKFSSSIGSDFKSKVGALFTVAAAEEGVRKILEYTGHINDLSDELGMSTDAIQQWDYALRLAGSDIDKAAGFFEHLAASRDKALGGDADALDAFSKLGISPSDLRNKRLEDIGAQIGNTIKTGDAQKLIGALKEVGGKGATSMMAAFKAGIQEALKDAPLIKEKDIIDLDALGDKFTSLGKTLLATFAPLLATIARVIGSDIDRRILTLREAASFASTLVKTGSPSEAYKAAIAETQKFLDEEGKKQAAKNKPGSGGGDATSKGKSNGMAHVYEEVPDKADMDVPRGGPNLNSLQHIGAFAASMNSTLQTEIRNNTNATKENSDLIRQYGKTYKTIVPPGFENSTQDNGRGVMFG